MRYDDVDTLRVTLDAGVATVTIDHPPLNILDAELLRDIDRFAGTVRDDDAVRVIVFQSGDPEFFMPHGDLNFIDDPAAVMALPVAMDEDASLNPMQRVFERVRKLPQAMRAAAGRSSWPRSTCASPAGTRASSRRWRC